MSKHVGIVGGGVIGLCCAHYLIRAGHRVTLIDCGASAGESSSVTSIRARCGQRIHIAVGVDDAIVEGIAAGARCWIAGTVNSLPHESVELFELALAGKHDEAFDIYKWFLPLLKLDVVPKFVQLIKLAQQEAGVGSEIVRGPRLILAGSEREAALALIRRDLARRPASVPASTSFGA